jgi:hypothetical protein
LAPADEGTRYFGNPENCGGASVMSNRGAFFGHEDIRLRFDARIVVEHPERQP